MLSSLAMPFQVIYKKKKKTQYPEDADTCSITYSYGWTGSEKAHPERRTSAITDDPKSQNQDCLRALRKESLRGRAVRASDNMMTIALQRRGTSCSLPRSHVLPSFHRHPESAPLYSLSISCAP